MTNQFLSLFYRLEEFARQQPSDVSMKSIKAFVQDQALLEALIQVAFEAEIRRLAQAA